MRVDQLAIDLVALLLGDWLTHGGHVTKNPLIV
jgi:hypothetical protein